MRHWLIALVTFCALGAEAQWKEIPAGFAGSMFEVETPMRNWRDSDGLKVMLPGYLDSLNATGFTVVHEFSWNPHKIKQQFIVLGPSNVDIECWLNGESLGVKPAGKQRMRIDVKDRLELGKHRLELKGKSGPERAWLAELPGWTFADLDTEVLDAKELKLALRNPSKPHLKHHAVITEFQASHRNVRIEEETTIKAGRTSEFDVSYSGDIHTPWCVENPEPNVLSVSHATALGQETLEVNMSRPKVEIRDDQILINGHREWFQGAQVEMPTSPYGPSLDEGTLQQTISRLRKNNLNTILWTDGNAPEALLTACDKYGLYVFEMTQRTGQNDGYHPSLMGWLTPGDDVTERGYWSFYHAPDVRLEVVEGDAPYLLWPMGDLRGNGLGGWKEEWHEHLENKPCAGAVLSAWNQDGDDSVFTADGKAKPLIHEIADAFERFGFRLEGNQVFISNRMHSKPESGLFVMVHMLADGNLFERVYQGALTAAPGEVMEVGIPELEIDGYSDVHLDVSVVDPQHMAGMGGTHVQAREQFVLQTMKERPVESLDPSIRASGIEWTLADNRYVISIGQQRIEVDANSGMPISHRYHDQELFAMAPTLMFGRTSPVDDPWPPADSEKRWRDSHKLLTVDYSEIAGNELKFVGQLGQRMGEYQLIYRMQDRGMYVELAVRPESGKMSPPRVGFRFVLLNDFEDIQWVGSGPHSSYVDRGGAVFGIHKKTRESMVPRYQYVAEAGSRLGWRSLSLESAEHGIFRVSHIGALDDAFTFSSFLEEEMWRSGNGIWPRRPFAVLTIDDFQAPLSGKGDGAPSEEAYRMAFRYSWEP